MLFCLLLVLFFIPNVRTQQAGGLVFVECLNLLYFTLSCITDVLHEKAIELATRGSYTAALSVFR